MPDQMVPRPSIVRCCACSWPLSLTPASSCCTARSLGPHRPPGGRASVWGPWVHVSFGAGCAAGCRTNLGRSPPWTPACCTSGSGRGTRGSRPQSQTWGLQGRRGAQGRSGGVVGGGTAAAESRGHPGARSPAAYTPIVKLQQLNPACAPSLSSPLSSEVRASSSSSPEPTCCSSCFADMPGTDAKGQPPVASSGPPVPLRPPRRQRGGLCFSLHSPPSRHAALQNTCNHA